MHNEQIWILTISNNQVETFSRLQFFLLQCTTMNSFWCIKLYSLPLYFFIAYPLLLHQGSEWVLAKKSEKCVMQSLVGDSCESVKELWRACFLQVAGLGFLPQKSFGMEGREWCIPMFFLGHFTQIAIPHPLTKFSSDLHWSQEWSWELEKSLKSDLSLKILSPVHILCVNFVSLWFNVAPPIYPRGLYDQQNV